MPINPHVQTASIQIQPAKSHVCPWNECVKPSTYIVNRASVFVKALITYVCPATNAVQPDNGAVNPGTNPEILTTYHVNPAKLIV